MRAALETKPRGSGTTAPAHPWRIPRGKIAGSARSWQDARFGNAKRAGTRTRRGKQAEAAYASAVAATPVAVCANGAVLGLALRGSNGFRFFSAACGTDAFDGEVFASLDAIREAAGK